MGNICRKIDSSIGELVTQYNVKRLTSESHISIPTPNSEKCNVEVLNHTEEVLIFCWVNEDGRLFHFRPINNGSVTDASVSRDSHVELTKSGDAFVCFTRGSNDDYSPKCITDIPMKQFTFFYRPQQGHCRHVITVTATRRLCGAGKKRKRTKESVSVHVVEIPTKVEMVIQTSAKIYRPTKICDFTVNLGEDLTDSEINDLLTLLKVDLEQVSRLMPPKALVLLQQNTPLWVNSSIQYGPVDSPITGHGCCFHPAARWLIDMGMSEHKEGGVEMYSAKGYMKSRQLWGCGGLLLHEYSHAFHHKHCLDGYNNALVRKTYESAMSSGKYDAVQYHTFAGGGEVVTATDQKHYACTNCMEYWAELSVAYHHHSDPEVEYNKWFPHNRQQLQLHDPDAFNMLHSLWCDHEN